MDRRLSARGGRRRQSRGLDLPGRASAGTVSSRRLAEKLRPRRLGPTASRHGGQSADRQRSGQGPGSAGARRIADSPQHGTDPLRPVRAAGGLRRAACGGSAAVRPVRSDRGGTHGAAAGRSPGAPILAVGAGASGADRQLGGVHCPGPPPVGRPLGTPDAGGPAKLDLPDGIVPMVCRSFVGAVAAISPVLQRGRPGISPGAQDSQRGAADARFGRRRALAGSAAVDLDRRPARAAATVRPAGRTAVDSRRSGRVGGPLGARTGG